MPDELMPNTVLYLHHNDIASGVFREPTGSSLPTSFNDTGGEKFVFQGGIQDIPVLEVFTHARSMAVNRRAAPFRCERRCRLAPGETAFPDRALEKQALAPSPRNPPLQPSCLSLPPPPPLPPTPPLTYPPSPTLLAPPTTHYTRPHPHSPTPSSCFPLASL